jgi:opacity protein-like surface antigen
MTIGKLIGLSAVALFVSTAAGAGDSSFYLGAGVGEARQHNFIFDGSDTSFKLLAGYSFSRYFAAEAGLIDAGTQKDTVGPFDVKSSSEGAFAALLAKLPLGNVAAPYAKLGYVLYDVKESVSTGGVTTQESRSGDDLLFGGGIEFRIGESFRLRAEYEKVDVSDIAFDITSIAFTYQF